MSVRVFHIGDLEPLCRFVITFFVSFSVNSSYLKTVLLQSIVLSHLGTAGRGQYPCIADCGTRNLIPCFAVVSFIDYYHARTILRFVGNGLSH